MLHLEVTSYYLRRWGQGSVVLAGRPACGPYGSVRLCRPALHSSLCTFILQLPALFLVQPVPFFPGHFVLQEPVVVIVHPAQEGAFLIDAAQAGGGRYNGGTLRRPGPGLCPKACFPHAGSTGRIYCRETWSRPCASIFSDSGVRFPSSRRRGVSMTIFRVLAKRAAFPTCCFSSGVYFFQSVPLCQSTA